MKQNLTAILFSVAIVLASIILGYSYLNRTQPVSTISVTGLGEKDFTSDLIVWEAEFEKSGPFLQEVYDALAHDKKIIASYLKRKGIKNFVFTSVNTARQTKTIYSENGSYQGQEFVGYRLSQTVKIESKDVEKIERISREITELLNKGITLYSSSPRYYYTKLADLKIEMISKATENAFLRAKTIAEKSGAKLGKLKSAKMGIFQITGQNSEEDYSWGGTFNTSSKNKTASITMKLIYEVE